MKITGIVFIGISTLLVMAQVNAKTLFLKNGALSSEVVNMGTLSTTLSTQKSTDYYIVQFKNKILKAERDLLKSLQAEVIHYIPEDAYLVKISDEGLKKLQKNNKVELVLPYLSEWRVSQDFEPQSIFNAEKDVLVLLQSTSENELMRIVSELREQQVLRAHQKTAILKLQMKDLRSLSQKEGVEWIQPYQKPQLMHIDLHDEDLQPLESENMAGDYSDIEGYESGTKIMKFQQAWERGFTGLSSIAHNRSCHVCSMSHGVIP